MRQLLTRVGLGLVGAGIGLGLGWVAIRGADWGEVVNAMRQFPAPLLLLALALYLLSGYLRAVRWRLLWTDEKVSAFRLFLVENAALGLNNISPVRAVDEAVQFGILTFRDKLPGGSVIATMMMCRIQDLAFTLVFIIIVVAITPQLLRFTPAVVFTSVFFGIWLLILLNLGKIVPRFPALRRIPGVTTFEATVNALWGRKRRMAVTFAVTAAYWLLLGPVGWLIARGLGLELSFMQIMVTVFGAIFFSTALPGLPGAIGTFEFAVVSLLELWGIPQDASITFAILLHALLFIPPTIVAVIVLPMEGLRSIGDIRDISKRWQESRNRE